jgi:hypothetical protein
MAKCNWCGKYYKDELFSNGFCSKKCELEGGDRGVKATSPAPKLIGIIVLIAIFAVFAINKNSKKSTETKANSNLENYNQEESVYDISTQETNFVSESSNNTENEPTESEEKAENEQSNIPEENVETTILEEKETENSTNQNVPSRMLKYQEHQVEVSKAIEMLKQDKSVSEIKNATKLEGSEIRELRRKLRNEE